MKIHNKIYNDTIDLVFDTGWHRYTVDGVTVPGVTTILSIVSKDALIPWAAKCTADYYKEAIKPEVGYSPEELEEIYINAKKAHTKKKTDAADTGTITHQWVSDHIEGKDPGTPTDPIVAGAVERFLNWEREHKVEFLLSEQPCYSKKYNYAGIIDFICRIDGKLYCGDLKTNNAFHANSMFSQVSAYKLCREEEFGEHFDGILVCRVGKTDVDFEVRICEDTKPFEDNFLNCLALYRSEKLIKELYPEKPYKKTTT